MSEYRLRKFLLGFVVFLSLFILFSSRLVWPCSDRVLYAQMASFILLPLADDGENRG